MVRNFSLIGFIIVMPTINDVFTYLEPRLLQFSVVVEGTTYDGAPYKCMKPVIDVFYENEDTLQFRAERFDVYNCITFNKIILIDNLGNVIDSCTIKLTAYSGDNMSPLYTLKRKNHVPRMQGNRSYNPINKCSVLHVPRSSGSGSGSGSNKDAR